MRALDAAAGGGSRLAFFPSTDSAWMPAITLFVYLGVNWWASWYPGAEPGGGGYVAQRIFSREGRAPRAVRDALVQHRALRRAALAVDPDGARLARALSRLVDKESGYVRTLMDPAVFPPALRGIMLAAFAAAYMSTIGTQLNWGASYVVNDFYRRFVRRDGTEREYVVVVAGRDRRADAGVDLRDAASGVDRAGVEAADRDRRRHRHGAAAALVLVADQRLVGSVGDGRRRRRVALSADRARMGQRRPREFAYIMLSPSA